MNNKHFVMLCVGLFSLILSACTFNGENTDNSAVMSWDIVSVRYAYSFENWDLIDRGTEKVIAWSWWLQSIILQANVWDVLEWSVSWKNIYHSEYDEMRVQSFANIIMTEVLNIDNPEVWTEVYVESIWTWSIVDITHDDEWYKSYIVDFNDAKTYKTLLYKLEILSIERE